MRFTPFVRAVKLFGVLLPVFSLAVFQELQSLKFQLKNVRDEKVEATTRPQVGGRKNQNCTPLFHVHCTALGSYKQMYPHVYCFQ